MMKALVVDDDPNIVRLVQVHLTQMGFTISTAQNGLQALEQVREIAPHLIVLDVEMPQMNGIEFLKKLRKNPTTAHIPVIMLTGKDKPIDVLDGWEVGADLYLTKPFHPAQFRLGVEHIFSTTEEKPIPAPPATE